MTNSNSNMYLLINVQKAFDRVDHAFLFQKLNLPPVVTRFLLSWYSSQWLRVRWCKSFSDSFTQPLELLKEEFSHPSCLATVYTDDLLASYSVAGFQSIISCFEIP